MKKRFVLAAMLAAAPFAASAAGNGLSYTYVEGGYAQANINENFDDFGDVDASGGYIKGSIEISPSFYLFGSYAKASDDETIEPVEDLTVRLEDDLTQAEGGVGYHMAWGERVDFIAEAAYVSIERDVDVTARYGDDSDSDSVTIDQKGGRAAVGVRGGNDRAEGWLKIGYLSGSDFDGNFIGTLGGQFKFNRTWGLVGEVEVVDDVTRYTAGVRASF
ncbi:outer membrane beta-barrel protein [Lysobacter sp. UC]|uniref:Outer membrane beta-barrel protein n=2 Tax=Lysobacter arvi TaxID=3038776 RepID=A0ABU1CHF9_9GAMM|nr:outer membrane beta-barrel protein [Lysobacter arvi]